MLFKSNPSNSDGKNIKNTRTPYLYKTSQSGRSQTPTGGTQRSGTQMSDRQTGTPAGQVTPPAPQGGMPQDMQTTPSPQNDTMRNNMTAPPATGQPVDTEMPLRVSPPAGRTGTPASPTDRTGMPASPADRTAMPVSPAAGSPQQRGSITTPPGSGPSMPNSMTGPMNRGTTTTPQTGGQIPGGTMNRPQNNMMSPGTPMTRPQNGMFMPGGTMTGPQNGMPTPGGTMTCPQNGMPMPGGTMTRPQNGMPMPCGTMTRPQNGMPMPGGTMTSPQNNMTTPGTPMTGPQNNMTTPGTPMTGPQNGMPTPGTGTPVRQGISQMPQETVRPIVTCPFYPAGTGNMQGNTSNNASPVVPLFPLYGYDNGEDVDRDWEYMKQLYPSTAKTILREINDECDKLEYDGSFMFDEYPDKTSIDSIVDRVYERIRNLEEEPQVEMNSVYYYPRRRSNFLRDIVSLVLLNELFNRRRRYNRRRRWF